LSGLELAGSGVTWGHINDQSQTIAGDKTFSGSIAASNLSGTNTGNETTTTTGVLISGATAKTTPIDADSVGLSDSAGSGMLKKLTWANLKSTLKTYFDGFYLRGIGMFTSSSDTSGVTTSTVLPIFGSTVYNNASGVSVTSATVVTLQAGKTYKLNASLFSGDYSLTADGIGTFRFYNITAAAYTGSQISIYPGPTAANRSQQPLCQAIIAPSVTTTVSLICNVANGTFSVFSAYSFVSIEEI
jgi:hypothetical protein